MADFPFRALAIAALLAAAPATADVKTGVDAWGRGDYTRAVQEWRPLAVAGDADAQFNLGQAYKLGRGVPVDPAQALEWFRRAAEKGHLQAQDNYGIGLFQANRRGDAVPWLERSATRGEPRAQLVLGTMLFNGDGVRTDYPRAYALMTRASQAGLPSASETLAQMDSFVTPTDRQRGLQLAQEYAQQASAAQVAARTAPGSGPVRTAAVPPSRAARSEPLRPLPLDRRPTPGVYAGTPGAQVPPPPEPSRRPSAAPAAAPQRAVSPARGGNWRVQLGAFRDRGNAEALWRRVGERVGGRPAYVQGGGVVRLQATGFADRAAAQRACAAAGTACNVVAP